MQWPWSKPKPAGASVAADWKIRQEWVDCPPPRNYVAGESFALAALDGLVPLRSKDGCCEPVEVTIIREPENEYDRNAFRVEVDGTPVGHMRRHIAAQLAPVL